MNNFNIFIGTAFPILVATAAFGLVVAIFIPFLVTVFTGRKKTATLQAKAYLIICLGSCLNIYIFHLIWAMPFRAYQDEIRIVTSKYIPEINDTELKMINALSDMARTEAQREFATSLGQTLTSCIRAFVDGATLGFSRSESLSAGMGAKGFSLNLSGSKGIFIESEKAEIEMKKILGDQASQKVRFDFYKEKLEQILTNYKSESVFSRKAPKLILDGLTTIFYLQATAFLFWIILAHKLGFIVIIAEKKNEA